MPDLAGKLRADGFSLMMIGVIRENSTVLVLFSFIFYEKSKINIKSLFMVKNKIIREK
jgi:hypothetical protein